MPAVKISSNLRLLMLDRRRARNWGGRKEITCPPGLCCFKTKPHGDIISGSQVRSLSCPPPSPLFWHFAETVEKGPLLAGFFISAQTDPGLCSRKCGEFDP